MLTSDDSTPKWKSLYIKTEMITGKLIYKVKVKKIILWAELVPATYISSTDN